MGEGLITKNVARNIRAQMAELDRQSAEWDRIKKETMDGHPLVKGLEVFPTCDPFYSIVIFDPQYKDTMARCTCRHSNDRRKTYVAKMHKTTLYKSQFEAACEALKKHDITTKDMTCKLSEAEQVKAERAEKRLEILDVMAMCINKKDPHNVQLNMESKRFKKRRKKK